MNPSISDKLEQLTGRLDELDRMLASGQATQDMDEYRRLSREHAELGPVVALYQVWRQTQKDLLSGIEMLADPEMRELAEAEVATARSGCRRSRQTCRNSCCPRIFMTTVMFFWRSALALAVTSRRCLPVICFACMYAMPSEGVGRWK